jgi:drug/metabolite transporter (DMT)-like permease
MGMAAAGANRSIGAALVTASSIGFAASSIIVRAASDSGLSTFAITFYVGCVRFILCALVVLARGEVSARALCAGQGYDFVLLCIFRQALGALSIVGAFGAFARIPIGNATVLLFTSPVWTIAMARVCLGEAVTRTGQLSAVFVILGVALVARASASVDEAAKATQNAAAPLVGEAAGTAAGLVGTACALVASVSDAMFIVATRAIDNRQDSVTLTMWMGFSIVATMAPICAVSGVELTPANVSSTTIIALVASGFISLLSNVWLNMGLEKLEAAPANVLGALQVPIAYLLQLTLMRQPATLSAGLGALIIVVCALLVTLTKAEPPPERWDEQQQDEPSDAQPLLGVGRQQAISIGVEHLE